MVIYNWIPMDLHITTTLIPKESTILSNRLIMVTVSAESTGGINND